MELDDYEAGYVAGFAVGASLVLVALWMQQRSQRRRQLRDLERVQLELAVCALATEIAELKARLPQEVVE